MPDDHSSAYGGTGWLPRTAPLRAELGAVWAACGSDSEHGALHSVLLHEPGAELEASADPDAVQMLEPVDAARAGAQHRTLQAAYRDAGVTVHLAAPRALPPPNLMFVADLLFMTPEGAILGRPASTVRAGEERLVARRLAELGVPILRSVRGRGTFEGADAAWLDPRTVLVGVGLRTNPDGAGQVAATLAEQGVDTEQVALPPGVMHLMGVLRRLDRDLALAWPERVPERALELLRARGVEVLMAPDRVEADRGHALNLVALGPRRVVLPAGNPRTQALLEAHGVRCIPVEMDEITKAAGAIACLTAVLDRELDGASPREAGPPRRSSSLP